MKTRSKPPHRLAKADAIRTASEFSETRLVACPNCKGRATIAPFGEAGGERLTCQCGAQREAQGKPLTGFDPWIRIETRWGTLYAWNYEHLTFIRLLIEAKLRERHPHPDQGWSNRSQLSRLPAWAKSRKNRAEILRAIDRATLHDAPSD